MRAAVTATVVLVVTDPAVAVKVPVEAPAATRIDAGTVSAVLLSVSVTVAPPAGADCESVTVQVEPAPEEIVPGEHWRAVTDAGGAPPPVGTGVIMSLWIWA